MNASSRLKHEFDEQLEFYKSAIIWDTSHVFNPRDQSRDDLFRDPNEEALRAKQWENFSHPRNVCEFCHHNQHILRAMAGKKGSQASTGGDESLVSFLRNFARDTTFHGVRRIENTDRSKFSRCVWLFIVCSMAIGLTYNVFNLIGDYYDYNTVTKSDIKIVTSMPFPSITLCNSCPYKNVDNTTDGPMNWFLRKSSVIGAFFQFNATSPDYRALMESDAEEIHEKYSFSATDLFFSAKYEGVNLNISDAFEVTDTLLGRCFTFNGPKYIEEHGTRQANVDGRYSGFQAYVTINQDKLFVNDDITGGIRMFLSHHPETPRYFKDGVDIHPGTSSRVALLPVTYTFLPKPYQSYGHEACHEMDETNTTGNSTFYSYETCMRHCELRVASQHCSCYSSLFFVDGLERCTTEQFHYCIVPHITKYKVNLSKCGCPRPCTFTRYDLEMSASQMPSLVSARHTLVPLRASSIPFLRESYLELRVFMQSFMVRSERHEPKFTLSSIFAFLGGQMGFFIGASLITLYEFIETILISCYLFLAHKAKGFGQVTTTTTTRINKLKAWT